MGGVDHLLRPIPLIRELFVVEVGNGAAAIVEDLGDLLEEFEVGMLHDPRLGKRIGTVLADHDHSIDRQLAGAKGQGFRNGGINLHGGMPIHSFLGQIALAPLIDVERYHVHRRMVESSGPSITIEEPVHHVLAVQ